MNFEPRFEEWGPPIFSKGKCRWCGKKCLSFCDSLIKLIMYNPRIKYEKIWNEIYKYYSFIQHNYLMQKLTNLGQHRAVARLPDYRYIVKLENIPDAKECIDTANVPEQPAVAWWTAISG